MDTIACDSDQPSKVILSQKLASPASTTTSSPIFKYVPLSCRKKGDSPFVEFSKDEKTKRKSPLGTKSEDLQVLKENLTTPLTKVEPAALPKTPLKGFVIPSGVTTEHGTLPEKRTIEGFDPKSYKLMEKSGYDFSSPPPLGVLSPQSTGEKVHGLTEMQNKLRQQGHVITLPKTGLGFTPEEPIRIPIRGKGKKANVQYITVEDRKSVV